MAPSLVMGSNKKRHPVPKPNAAFLHRQNVHLFGIVFIVALFFLGFGTFFRAFSRGFFTGRFFF